MQNKFSIILNSGNKIEGGTNNNATYHFDFSMFEQCEYNVSFNFSGIPAPLTTVDLAPILQVGLSQNNTYAIGNQISNTIGPLCLSWVNRPIITGTSTDTLQTLRMFLPQNFINVRLVTYDERTLWIDFNTFDILRYILIMTFEKVTAE